MIFVQLLFNKPSIRTLNSYTDIDECAVNNGGCAQVCLNTLGSFSCACMNGFQLSGDGRNCSGKYSIVSTLCFKQNLMCLLEYQH